MLKHLHVKPVPGIRFQDPAIEEGIVRSVGYVRETNPDDKSDSVWVMLEGSFKIKNCAYAREGVQRGYIMPADEETAKACKVPFVPEVVVPTSKSKKGAE